MWIPVNRPKDGNKYEETQKNFVWSRLNGFG
jgi:hypothetical protein